MQIMNDKSDIEWRSMSDVAINKIIGSFIKHHRLTQNKTQDEVARDAGISRSTLSLLERGETVTIATLLQVLRELDLLYVMDAFKIQQQISPIELARIEQRKRQRARSQKSNLESESDW